MSFDEQIDALRQQIDSLRNQVLSQASQSDQPTAVNPPAPAEASDYQPTPVRSFPQQD